MIPKYQIQLSIPELKNLQVYQLHNTILAKLMNGQQSSSFQHIQTTHCLMYCILLYFSTSGHSYLYVQII